MKAIDGSLWKFCKKISKKKENISAVLLVKSNQELPTDQEKAKAFAEHFAHISNEDRGLGSASSSLKVKREVNKFQKNTPDLDVIEFVKYSEIKKAIKNFKNSKTPGHDNLSVKIIKNLPRKVLAFLLKIINGIFVTGHYPEVWKIAEVIPVPKKGKDPIKICSYRPISLLSYINKIVEKIVKSRIVKFLDDKKIIAKEQFGFGTGHSTVDQLTRLTNEITKNFNIKKQTGALLLDIGDVFPTVWLI